MQTVYKNSHINVRGKIVAGRLTVSKFFLTDEISTCYGFIFVRDDFTMSNMNLILVYYLFKVFCF